MSVVSVQPKDFILALFIRDDGERFLLGDNGYDFTDSQLHFAANTIENDEVEKQGADGTMLAGQVRRASVQTFDGYVGDATTPKEEIEQMRRAFIAFFLKGHHYRVIYVDCARNAWQRKGGYLVDAPEVKELFQVHPEYHVGLNFEDVNYYSYDENAEGDEITANLVQVAISSAVEGGLVWDEDGAVSEDATVVYDGDTATASGTSITVSDAVEAPLSDFKLKGNTTQQTYSGKNLYPAIASTTSNDITYTQNADGTYNISGTSTAQANAVFWLDDISAFIDGQTYTISVSPAPTNMSVLVEAYNGTTWQRTLFDANATNPIRTSAINMANADRLKFSLRVQSGRTVSLQNLKIQLEKNSSQTTWERYVGGIPAPNPDYPQAVKTVTGENVVNICGKNLFDKSKATLGYRISSDGAPYADSPYFISDFIPVKANTAYRINTANVGGSSAIATYDKDKVFIRRILGDGYQNIVTDANALYIRFATSQTVIDQAQLELGSTATDYEPYQEQSYPISLGSIELCKIGDYQDSIYKSGDKWYVHKETGKVNLSDCTWYNVVQPGILKGTTSITNIKYTSSNQQIGDAVAEKYIIHKGSGMSAPSLAGYFAIDTAMVSVNTGDSSISPTGYMFYALATPTDTEITNEALIEQLEAILSQGYTYAGTNNITTVIAAGNEQGELEVGYYTRYDFTITAGGYEWEQGGSGGPTTVMNESIDNVYPIWTITGPITNPVLENTTTGEQIEYVGTIGDGQTLVIDMGAQTALLDGLNVVANIVGEFLSLAPGSNTLIYSVDSGDKASEIGWSEIVG